MSPEELYKIIQQPENSLVEFKRDDIRPESLAKEIVAFANFKGGHIIIGVDDISKEIIGLQRKNFEEWLMDTVFAKYITPSIIPIYQEISLENDKKLAVITVEQGSLKPYAVKKSETETIYIRIGSTSRIADREQILRMSQESGYYHFEIAPVSGTSIHQIDSELFSHFYKKTMEEEVVDWNDFQLRLSQLDFLVAGTRSEFVCSIAGLILFGKDILRFLPQYGIRIIRYKSTEVELECIEDKLFTNPIARIKKLAEIEKNGIVDSAITYLAEHLSEVKIDKDGITRIREWRVPESILRELIVNGLIHRDYTKRTKNEIRIFSDRIEFESAGRLPNTLTIEKIKIGQKYPRNPILVQYAQYLNLMEHKGLGIRKVVLAELKKHGFAEPIFQETEDSFCVIVYFK
ncbi:MAG: putative DNA binding domain-containing protein [Leptospiraceae bacterium]|nr:putative DNA binding domain-containing protein [Leptospiraceae bacterium]